MNEQEEFTCANGDVLTIEWEQRYKLCSSFFSLLKTLLKNQAFVDSGAAVNLLPSALYATEMMPYDWRCRKLAKRSLQYCSKGLQFPSLTLWSKEKTRIIILLKSLNALAAITMLTVIRRALRVVLLLSSMKLPKPADLQRRRGR